MSILNEITNVVLVDSDGVIINTGSFDDTSPTGTITFSNLSQTICTDCGTKSYTIRLLSDTGFSSGSNISFNSTNGIVSNPPILFSGGGYSVGSAISETTVSEPTAQATSLILSIINSGTIDVSWSAPSPSVDGVIVFVQTGSYTSFVPVDNIFYILNEKTGSGTFVAYSGSDSAFRHEVVSSSTEYFYNLFSFNDLGSTINYYTTNPLSGSATTSASVSEPATQPTNLILRSRDDKYEITQSAGGGGDSIVIATMGSSIMKGSTVNYSPLVPSGGALDWDGSSFVHMALPEGFGTYEASVGSVLPSFANRLLSGSTTGSFIIRATGGSDQSSGSDVSDHWQNEDGGDFGTFLTDVSASEVLTGNNLNLIIYNQGADASTINDSSNIYSVGDYRKALEWMIKKTTLQFPSMSFFIMQTGRLLDGSNSGSRAAVRTAQRTISENTDFSHVHLAFTGAYSWSSAEYYTDNTHWSMVANNYAGNQMGLFYNDTASWHLGTPATITNLTASEVGDTSIKFQWTNQSSSTHVVLESGSTFMKTLYADDVQYEVTGGLTASREYRFRVRNGNPFAMGAWASVTASTIPGIPEPINSPNNFSMSLGTESIDLSWNAGAGRTDGYVVLRKQGTAITGSPSDGIVYSVNDNVGDATVEYVGTGTSFTDLLLFQNTEYFYNVYAYNGHGVGASIDYLASSFATVSGTTATGSAYYDLLTFSPSRYYRARNETFATGIRNVKYLTDWGNDSTNMTASTDHEANFNLNDTTTAGRSNWQCHPSGTSLHFPEIRFPTSVDFHMILWLTREAGDDAFQILKDGTSHNVNFNSATRVQLRMSNANNNLSGFTSMPDGAFYRLNLWRSGSTITGKLQRSGSSEETETVSQTVGTLYTHMFDRENFGHKTKITEFFVTRSGYLSTAQQNTMMSYSLQEYNF